MSHIIEQLPRGYVPSKHIIRIEIYLQSHNFNNSYFSNTNYNSSKRNIRKRRLKMRYVSLEGSIIRFIGNGSAAVVGAMTLQRVIVSK